MTSALGKYVSEQRKALNLSQNGLAKKAKLSVSAVNRLEAGETVPETKTLKALAKALNVSLNSLLERLQDRPTSSSSDDSLSELIQQLSERDKDLVEQCVRVFLEYKKEK